MTNVLSWLDPLNMRCSEEHLLQIATLNYDWRMVGRRLIEHKTITDIDREEHIEQNKRDKMLMQWVNKKGNAATYRVLIEVLQRTGNVQAAEAVQKLASSIVIEGKTDIVTLLVYVTCILICQNITVV